jgi:hypothetical protein
MQEELTAVLDMIEEGRVHPIDAEDTLLEGLSVEDPQLRARVLRHTGLLIDSDELARRHLQIVQDENCSDPERANAAVALGPCLEECGGGTGTIRTWNRP